MSRGAPSCKDFCDVYAGVKLYHLPMGAGQTKGDALHGWGSAHDAFWCCYGSSVESFAKLADSIYFFRWGVCGVQGLGMYDCFCSHMMYEEHELVSCLQAPLKTCVSWGVPWICLADMLPFNMKGSTGAMPIGLCTAETC